MLSKPEYNYIFSLIIDIKKNVQEKAIMEIFFQGLYFVELILIFLVITNQDHSVTKGLLGSIGLVLVIGVITALILVQIAVALVWKIYLQLYNQLVFYRYFIFPLIMLFFASQINSPIYFGSLTWLPLVLMLVELLIIYILCSLVFHEYSQTQIVYSSSEYAKYLVFTDALMVLSLPAKGTIWLPVTLTVWGILSLVVNSLMRSQVRKNTSNKFISFIIYFKVYLLLMLIFSNIGYQQSLRNKILLASCPIVLLLLVYSFVYLGKQTLDSRLFNGQLAIEQFTRFVYFISAEITQIKTNINIPLESSFLMIFIAIHRSVCTNTACLLHQQSTYDEIQNSGEHSYRKMVIHKIVKKVQSLIQLYSEKNTGDVGLKIMKMQFYSVHLTNKLKIKHIMSSIQYRKLTLKNKLVVYNINQKANSMNSTQFIDSSKAEDEYEIFKKNIMEMLILLREFWSALSEEKIDINNLILKSSKVFPIKREIQNAWKKSLTQEKFSSWSIIKTYTIYCKSILHDYTRSGILDDYSKILETRLKSKQELGYMKFDTESGVVAISLSESSLGNLHSVNRLAVSLFNYYSSKEMLSLRVNDIMPQVYSIVHDGILNSFLKNRYKSINQDERLVYGRNKNGFIFPIQLQLRKLSWNTNDELIFIASVNSIKTKTAPILCIVDLEGDLKNVSSTFSWLFLGCKINNRRMENIQVILPSFFKIIQEQEQQHLNNYSFQEKCMVNKTSGSFEVQFTGYPLYIKGNRVGYLIEGHTIDNMNTINTKKKVLGDMLRKSQGRTLFNEVTFRYEIYQNDASASRTHNLDLSIPFLRTEDIEVMFGDRNPVKESRKQYGEGIRTFRLVNNRIELAIQESSFASEISQDNWRQSSVLKRIQRMHEEINIENNKNVASFYKMVLQAFAVILVAIAILILFEAIFLGDRYTESNLDLLAKWKIRTLFPQLLIYSYFPSSLGTNTHKIDTVRNEFINSLTLPTIAQWQKQSMIRITNAAYYQQRITFEPDLLTFSSQNPPEETIVILLVFLFSGLLLAQIVAVLCMFSNYQATIQKMYSIFLSVTDRKLTEIMKESQKLYDYLLHYPSNNFHEDEDQQKNLEENEQESPIMKKIKKSSESWDTKIAYRLAIPLFLLFLIGLVSGVFITIFINKCKSNRGIWKIGSEMSPSSSLATLQKLFPFLNMTGSFNLTNSFHQYSQQFERSIFIQNLDHPHIDIWLKGNLCVEQAYYQTFTTELQSYCQSNIQQDNSLANNINFLDSYLYSSLNETTDKWIAIVKMQYELIVPLLTYAMNQIQGIIEEQEKNVQQLLIAISFVAISLVCILTVYFVRFPLRQMDQKILFTKDLISIIPSEKQREPNITLATLTTEALEFKDYYE